jgi:uncharacterized phage-associated protein
MNHQHNHIRFIFDEHKATEAAARLIGLAGGRMNYMKLIKLLYVAERRSLEQNKRPICGDTYFALKDGPVLSVVLDLIKDRVLPDQPRHWPTFISTHDWDVQLDRVPDPERLSRADLAILDEVFDDLGHMNQWQLRAWTHNNCPEWEDPGLSRFPICPEDILHVLGVDGDEIDRIRLDMEERRRMFAILPTR